MDAHASTPPPTAPRGPLLRTVTPLWHLLVAISLVMIVFGVYSYAYQYQHGDIVTGLRNPGNGGAAWGFYIVFYVYFCGVSFAGIVVASMARLFHIDTLKPVSRMAELLTIVSLLVGAMMVIADLGRPLHGLKNLPEMARPSSPFFGTFTLVVSAYLCSSLVFFIVAGRGDAARMVRQGPRVLRPIYRLWASGWKDEDVVHARHWRASYWLALTILPLLVIAHSTLGFIFGIQAGRPGWFGALQAPGFVVLAGVSGTGMLILFAVVGRRMFRIKDRIPDDGIKWLGNFLWVLALVYLYFMVTEELTASYAAPRADREMAHDVVTGTYAVSFWLVVSCLFFTFLIPFVMYLRGRSSIFWLCVAGVLSNVAAILKRLIIVVPSQTHGGLIQLQKGVYHPSWVEYGVVIGAGGLLMLAVLLFGRWFPLAPTPVDPRRREAHIPRDLPRAFATITWGLASITLIVVGLLDSFRLFSHGEIDPRIKFSPAMFATGVIMLFSTAIVYEAFPERRRGPTARALPGSRTSPRRGLEPGRGIRRVDVKRHLRSSRDLRTRRQP